MKRETITRLSVIGVSCETRWHYGMVVKHMISMTVLAVKQDVITARLSVLYGGRCETGRDCGVVVTL